MTESPRTYREKNPYTPPPPEYKPPSLIAEHWKLATLFTLVCIAFAAYCLRTPRAHRDEVRAPAAQSPPASANSSTPKPGAGGPTAAPIYIEAIAEEPGKTRP